MGDEDDSQRASGRHVRLDDDEESGAFQADSPSVAASAALDDLDKERVASAAKQLRAPPKPRGPLCTKFRLCALGCLLVVAAVIAIAVAVSNSKSSSDDASGDCGFPNYVYLVSIGALLQPAAFGAHKGRAAKHRRAAMGLHRSVQCDESARARGWRPAWRPHAANVRCFDCSC